MAQPSISGSALGNITARRAQLSKIRQRLNLEGGPQAPQGNLRQVAPSPPTGPAQIKTGQKPPEEIADFAPADDKREAMLARIREFQSVNSGQFAGAAPSKTATPQMQREQRPLLERIQSMGAAALSPQQQFMRLAGRPPAPREISMFNARIILERQLGRPPTSIEMRLFMARPGVGPESLSPALPRALEV